MSDDSRRHRFPHTPLAALVAFALAWVHGFAPEFLYDAAQYWGGAFALVSGGDPVASGGLTTRGVYTVAAYLPPAAVSAVLGPDTATWTVLAWNAAIGAVLTAVLVPRLVQACLDSSIPSPPPSRVWVSAILGGFLVSGFARFPLVDVTATTLALAGIFGLLVARRWYVAVLAGLALSLAANMRPSLLGAIGLAAVVLLFLRARSLAIAAAAGVAALAPQVVLNAVVFASPSVVPRETTALSAVQAAYAHVALRYDTVAFADQRPQQWYCDPGYAASVVSDGTPLNQLQVIGSALAHLPESLWFLLRKAAASVHWTWGTPYEPSPGYGADAVTIVAIAVSAFGIVALVAAAIRARADRPRLLRLSVLLAFWVGAVGVLVFSTPETRFAVPIVLIGLVGTVAAVPPILRAPRVTRGAVIVGVVALALAGVLFASATEALTHAYPAGPLADAAACAARS